MVSIVVKVQGRGSERPLKCLGGMDPDGPHYAQARVALSVPELKREVLRLDMDTPRGDEDGLEADAE